MDVDLKWESFKKRQQQRKRNIRMGVAVAASICLLITSGLWLWLGTLGEERVVLAEQGRQNNVCLVLSTGEMVDISNVGQEEVKLDKGTKLYEGNRLEYVRPDSLHKKELEFNQLIIPKGTFYHLVLSDGTKVWLNADSELKYPVRFVGGKREVYLKGEGYFQVSKDSCRQFIVHLQNSEITVLGTAFNVSAYEDEAHVYTTLEEGRVAFYSRQNKQRILLKPGMQSDMEVATGKTVVSEVDPSLYSAWIEGRFVFQSLDLESILRQLQRWYDFEVFFQQQEVKNYRFRGVLSRDMDIRQALDIIEETTDLKFDIKGKTILVRK